MIPIKVIIGLIIFIIVILAIGFFYNTINPDNKMEPFSFYTCYMKLYDINPQFSSNYLKLNNKYPKCGPCKGSTLKVRVEPCDSSGNCNPTVKLYSSQGMYIPYDKSITPTDIRNFFCL